MKPNHKSHEITVNLTTATCLLIILGLLCIVVSNIFLNVLDDEFLKKYYAVKPIIDIANALGTTLFSAGLVSVLIEISTIKNLVSEALNNVLQGDIPLDSYSDKKLEHINKQIAAKRGNVNNNFIEDCIYKVEPQLVDLLDGLYYNYYNAVYEVVPDEENGVFRKSVTLDYEIINSFEKSNKVCHNIQLYNLEPNMTTEKRKEKFKVNKFKINDTDLSDEAESYIQIMDIKEKHSVYQYILKFERPLQHCRKHVVHIEFEYEVPINDFTQIFRLTYPCKSMSHEIYINDDKDSTKSWKTHGNAFVSFFYKESKNRGFRVKQKHDTNLTITFNDWSIPGAGYMVYFTKH